MKVVVLLGAPGSGKGTVAALLVRREPSVCHVSSGDLLRAAVKRSDTPAARAAAETMRRGELVADAVVGALVVERLRTCAPDGILLLDGYPRNEQQAAALERELARENSRVSAAVWLDVPEDVLLARLGGRRICSQCAAGYHVENMKPRVDGQCDACGGKLIQLEDDQPERIANRLVVYREQTGALIGWYESRGLLVRVAGGEPADVVADRVARTVVS